MNTRRFKELIKYPLNEEMLRVGEFDKEPFYDSKTKTMNILVGIDEDNNKEYSISLHVGFTNGRGFTELAYFFLIRDKNGNLINTIYEESKATNYIPKDMQKKGLFLPKINYMTKELFKHEKPKMFFMVTAEDMDQNKLKRYDTLLKTLDGLGYRIENSGNYFESKKYFWKLVDKNSTITEEDVSFLMKPFPWDEYGKQISESLKANGR